MKNKYIKLIVLTFIALFELVSCDFLDVVPQNSATLEDIYKTPQSAEKMALSCYAQIPNYFNAQDFPDLTASNELITGWYGSVKYFHWKSLAYGLESPTSTYYALWSNSASSYPSGYQYKLIWNGIRYCYDLLDNIDKTPNIDSTDAQHYKGEAIFLIAYYHQIMLEYYGPIVLVKKEMSEKTSFAEMNVPRNTYDECVDFIAGLYTEAAKLLPAQWDPNNVNRASAAAALALKARLLLYAASPLVNGNQEYYANFKNPDGTNLINQTYDKEKWKKAMDAAKAAIDYCEANGYQLYGGATTNSDVGRKNYHEAFVGPSGMFNWDNYKEMLWGLADQGTVSYNIKCMAPRIGVSHYTSEGFRGYMIPTWDCITRYFTENGLPWNDDPETKDLDPYVPVRLPNGDSTACMNLHRSPRFYASIGYDRGKYEIAGGTIVLKCHRGEMQQNDGNQKNEYQSDNGYYCQKWVSVADSYNWNLKSYTYSKYIYPIIRLAEVYLDYVEADFEYNGQLSAQSLIYLNKIRARCGLPTFQDSWAKAGGIPTGDRLRQVLHDERSNELSMEGRYFHDIRRWKIADKVMMTYQKAWNLAGKTAKQFYQVKQMKEGGTRDFEAPKNYWLAIPLDQIQINPNLVQNPGY